MQISPRSLARPHLHLTPPQRNAGRGSSGSSQLPSPCSPPSPSLVMGLSGSKDNENLGQEDLTTGNSLSRFNGNSPSTSLFVCSPDAMQSFLAAPQRPHTAGKTLPQLKAPDSNLESSQSRYSEKYISSCSETTKSTGSPSGSPPSGVPSRPSPPQFVFKVIGPSVLLARIMPSLYLLSAEPSSTQGLLEVESPTKLGQNSQVLFLRTHGPSGGRATRVRRLLSLMNFEEVSTYRTSYAGSTSTLSVWKPKAHLSHYLQIPLSSPATRNLPNGTQN